MTKDEILEKSRQENKDSDERQKALTQKSLAISGAVGMMLCGIIATLEAIFGDSTTLFYGCFSIHWGMQATQGIVLLLSNKTKWGWIGTVLNVLFFIFFTVKLLILLI